MRSAENVMSEINWLLKNFEVRQIDILDDNFNLNPERTNRILDSIIAGRYGLAINCHNGLRVDRLTRELAGKLKRAGVFKVGVWVESGDERVLESVKKKLRLHMVRDVIKWFREENVVVHGFLSLDYLVMTGRVCRIQLILRRRRIRILQILLSVYRFRELQFMIM